MKITSSAFQNGGSIPAKYTGFGEDVSPDIIIEDLPLEMVSEDSDIKRLRAAIDGHLISALRVEDF